MFKGHPKGLYVLFFSNMGERYGYYTMVAIFAYYLQEHFGWSVAKANFTYTVLVGGTYIAALIGGLVADKFLGYGKTVLAGLAVMATGYIIMAQPLGSDPTILYVAMAVIALGVGLFKGNVVVITGNLYEDKKISHMRDSAMMLFYMGINIGAFFAPFTANFLKNLILKKAGLIYNNAIPKICQEVISGNNANIDKLKEFAGTGVTNLTQYAETYVKTISKGYNLAFGFAGVVMLLSMVVFILFKKYYKHADYLHKDKVKAGAAGELSKAEVKERVVALMIVFLAAICFWWALNSLGGIIQLYAKSYSRLTVSNITYLLFTPWTIIALGATATGLVFLFKKGAIKTRFIGLALATVGVIFLAYRYNSFPETNNIGPELFMAFNSIFIVLLTPIILAFFAWLRKKKMEPTSPTKITIGLYITAASFIILMVASFGLPKVGELVGGVIDSVRGISPYYIIFFNLIITVGELFLSPIGLSFVSKVAPPKMRGSMQAGWLIASGAGTLLAGVAGLIFEFSGPWQYFAMMIIFLALAGLLMTVFLGKIKKATGDN